MTPDEKMKLKEIKIQVADAGEDVVEMEDEMYSETSPKGKYTAKGMNNLIDAVNKLAPSFGIKDSLPRSSSDSTSFPPELVRILTMFAEAVEDAITGGILEEEMSIAGENPTDDTGLTVLAGKLLMASKSKEFKKFLLSPKPPVEEVEEEISEDDGEMSSEQMDDMFAARMR